MCINRIVIEMGTLFPEGLVESFLCANNECILFVFHSLLPMRGNLLAPMAAMLEKKNGCFDNIRHDIHVISGETDLNAVVEQIKVKREKKEKYDEF